ncbi:unnamed protein product [Effrenium voratum]|nr:unnamed protein product [Effrenium voratum]
MPKKRKRPLGAEGPPSATIAEINEVLLAPKRQFAAPVEAQRKPKAKARSAPMAAAKSAPKSAPAAPAAKSAPSAKAPLRVCVCGSEEGPWQHSAVGSRAVLSDLWA